MKALSSLRYALVAACVMVAGSPGVVFAQPSECDLRIGSGSVGGSLGLSVAEANVGYGSAGAGLWSQSDTRSGRGVSAELAVPIMPGWGARLDYARGHLAVEREITTSFPYGVFERTREGQVAVRHLTAGIVHAKTPPGLLCGYVGGGAGLYQFDYTGRRARNLGVFGLAGIEFGVGERSGLGFEIQLHAIRNNYEVPLRAETVLMLKPAVVFRVHF